MSFCAVISPTVKDGKRESVIRIFLKNISSSQLGLAWGPGYADEFRVFTLDSKGTGHIFYAPVHPLKANATEAERSDYLTRFILPANSESAEMHGLEPGEKIVRTIDLSPDDLAVLKTVPVQFFFMIGDRKAAKYYRIFTAPQKLPTFEN